jgi:plastocyanin
MTHRLTLAVTLILVIATGLAAFAAFSPPGASATAHGATTRAPGHPADGATMRMPMPMPATSAAAAAARPAVELHRKSAQVTISNFAFKPKRLVVSPGTKVVWTNKDSEPHTVTSDHPAFVSQAINTGGHYTLVARKTGTFTYHCQIHPFMHGTLVVQG